MTPSSHTGPSRLRRRCRHSSTRRIRAFATIDEGAPSDVYPALARVPNDLFGICVAGVGGAVFTRRRRRRRVHDHERRQAVRVRARLRRDRRRRGGDGGRSRRHRPAVQRRLGDRAERGRPHEPDGEPRCDRHHESRARHLGGGALAVRRSMASRGSQGEKLSLDEEVFESASATNHPNRAIARLLHERGRIAGEPDEAVDLYTRQSSVAVTARDLAVMGATLGDGGVNPITREQAAGAAACRHTLAVMTTAGSTRRRALALRRRAPRQERDRGRDRDRLTGQGRARDVRAAARRGRKQRQGTTRRAVPLAAARARSLCLGGRGVSFNGARRPNIGAYWPKRREEMGSERSTR